MLIQPDQQVIAQLLAERAGFELSVRTLFQSARGNTPGLARARSSHIDAAVEELRQLLLGLAQYSAAR